jgi:hypothetical protein
MGMIEEAVKRIDAIRQQRLNDKRARDTATPHQGPQAPEADDNRTRNAEDVFSNPAERQ